MLLSVCKCYLLTRAYPETTEDIGGLRLMLYAQILMAEIYYGPGEPHDPATAYGWVLLAICYGQPSNVEVTEFNFDSPMLHGERQIASMLEQMKEKLESELSAEHRAKGQRMATELFRSERLFGSEGQADAE